MLKSIGLMSCGHLVTMIICARVPAEVVRSRATVLQRQQAVFGKQTVYSRSTHVQACLHVAVLERHRPQDDVGAGIVQLQRLADAMAAVGIDRYVCLRNFSFI